ncbi:MAG TPA: OsmC family protein [Bryobacteraceae bacterium]|nr:OsmC family protein [Bryobacteraceae bacterium]
MGATVPSAMHRSTFRMEWKRSARRNAPAAVFDAIVASVAECLTAAFGEALEAREIDASHGRLTSETVGEIELEDDVPVLRRIHVRLKLKASESEHETAMRLHQRFAGRCGVFRTLKSAIGITTELSIEPEPEDMILGDQGQKGG